MKPDKWLDDHGVKPVYLVVAYLILLFLIGLVIHLLS